MSFHGLLPARPKPCENEHFLSWLTRVARANQCDPTQFTQVVLSGLDVWGGCVNGSSSLHPETILSQLTNIDAELISNLYTANYARRHFIELNQLFASHYLLPANCAGRLFTCNWIQFCPSCLREQKIAHFKNLWRISFMPVCLIHKCTLHACCPKCYKPVNFHRVSYSTEDCAECYNCRFPLSSAENHTVTDDKHLLYVCNLISAGIESRWVRLSQNSSVLMPLFIAGIWTLLKPFFRHKTAPRVREYFGLQLSHQGNNIKNFCHFTPTERCQLLSSIGILLRHWPETFLSTCSALELNKIAFNINEKDVPFWVDKILRYKVKRQPYWTSDAEFKSAAMFLKRRGYKVSYPNIAETLGLARSCQHNKCRTKIIKSINENYHSTKKFHWK
ncbi:TniQ family protein [Pseudoalteromonas sp. MSK9-3]|uniref:TniQ family protein n=1 Tax=Pseudoalteromonas sp. MSK9-3 TaxID=1897633 RepID=UPI0015FEE46E|nr:TniQ family protein [Pseudoalteromonas sp. MSK9-3]